VFTLSYKVKALLRILLKPTNNKHMRCQIPVSISHGLTVSCIDSTIRQLSRRVDVIRVKVKEPCLLWRERLNFSWLGVFRSNTIWPTDILSTRNSPTNQFLTAAAKCRVGQMSVGQMACRSNLRRPNGVSVKCPSAKRLSADSHVAVLLESFDSFHPDYFNKV
jgi:hypothetical protein